MGKRILISLPICLYSKHFAPYCTTNEETALLPIGLLVFFKRVLCTLCLCGWS